MPFLMLICYYRIFFLFQKAGVSMVGGAGPKCSFLLRDNAVALEPVIENHAGDGQSLWDAG